MIRRPPRSTQGVSSAASDVYKRQNESLAREIFDFPLPIISGVGHEIDFTITDFVADLRAPTPTAAAEMVTEYYFQLEDRLEEWKTTLGYLVQARLTEKSHNPSCLTKFKKSAHHAQRAISISR